jgi:hypothetical protein
LGEGTTSVLAFFLEGSVISLIEIQQRKQKSQNQKKKRAEESEISRRDQNKIRSRENRKDQDRMGDLR